MNWWNRLFGKGDVPEWAETFRSQRDRKEFERLVEKEVVRRFGPGELNWVEGYFDVPSANGGNYQLGFFNVARYCTATDRGEWESVIGEHFEKVARSLSDAHYDPEFEDIRDRLGPRLLDRDNNPTFCRFEGIDLGPLFAPGVQIDQEDRVSFVSDSMIQKWGKTELEVWEIALANLRRLPTLTFLRINKDADFYAAEENDFLAASHLLCLDRYPLASAEFGVMVAVPLRDSISLAPLKTKDDLRKSAALAIMANRLYHSQPGAITPHLVWWKDGIMKPCFYDPEKESIQAPQELLALLS